MVAEMIHVGRGASPDTRFFARELALLGIELRFQSEAADQRSLAQAMAQALRRSDVILTAGGVGMEPDDFTKEVICQGLQIPMDLHAESYQRLRIAFEAAGLPLPPGAQRAASLPRGSIVFAGDGSGVPGTAITAGDQCIVVLPGAPGEIIPMFMSHVYPFMAKFAGATVISRIAHVYGIAERDVSQNLYDLQNSRNPSMSVYTQRGETLVRVSARANTRAQAASMCTPFLKEIVSRLGDCVYGIDVETLESVVITHLTQKGLKLATAESCTGGLLSQRLNMVPGAAEVFKFGISAHANRVKIQALKVPEKAIKRFGAVSERVAIHMAYGAMDAGDAQIGVGITGAAGAMPGEDAPPGMFYIAVCNKTHVLTKELQLSPEMETVRTRENVVQESLNLVRLMLDYHPDPMPGAVLLSAALKGKAPVSGARAKPQKAYADPPQDDGGVPEGMSLGRKIVIAVLSVTLAAALAFIGYALWDQFLRDDGDGSSPKSSQSAPSEKESKPESKRASKPKEDPEEEDSSSDTEDPVEDDPDAESADSSKDDKSDKEDTSAPLGPTFGKNMANQLMKAPPPSQTASSASSASASLPPAQTVAKPAKSPSRITSVGGDSTKSTTPKVTKPASSAQEKSSAAPSKITVVKFPVTSAKAASSKGTASVTLKSGMVFNVHTGEYVSSTSSSEDEDAWNENDWDEEDHKDDSTSSDRGSGNSYDEGGQITVLNSGNHVTASMREIVERVVQMEMGASFEPQALKAQAVAAHTYMQFSLVRGQTPNVILSSQGQVSSNVKNAVGAVMGEQILYDGKPINATYFASAAGVTNHSEDVWQSRLPYLRSVFSDESVSEKTIRISRKNMRDLLEDEFKLDAEDYDEEEWIGDITYCSNDTYIKTIRFFGRYEKSGAWVRANLFTSLPSHAFRVHYNANDEEFVFTASGYGHGVGMSQRGAQKMAQDGCDYVEILEHYYIGTRVR